MIGQDLRSADIDTSIREQWLDKLWLCLFDASSSGLMSPGQIRRERRNREHVRQIEMAAILDAESEINDIHQGAKSLDDYGNVVETPLVEAVPTHQIIENTVVEHDADIGLDSPAMMIRSALKEVSVRDLERSLNLKKIAILAESEILAADITPVNSKPVNAEWMVRWRESAEDVFSPELQMLWARLLIKEVAQPGRFTLSVMSALHQLSQSDIDSLLVVAKYTFPDFIYNARDSYFNTDFHQRLFEEMEDLALFSQSASRQISLPSQHLQHSQQYLQESSCYSRVLVCRDKALKLTASDPASVLTLPIIKLSRAGRQLFELAQANTDLAYLFDLARYAKAQGFDAALGDWYAQGQSKGVFVEKMQL